MLTLSKFSGAAASSYGPRDINVASRRFTGPMVVNREFHGLKLHRTMIVKLVSVLH